MATQTVEFRSPPSQTITAKLFAIGSDIEVTSVSSTEATNRKGTYAAAYTDVAAGEYELIAFVGSIPVARWFVTLTLTTATFHARDKVGAVELDSDARVKLAATQPDYAPATTAALTSVANNVTAILEDTGTTLPAQISGISGGSGSGARTVTITVNDGTTALQNALIRLTEGANTFTATTNSSGVATFNVDDATYTVAITKSGYSYAGTTLVVDGTETRTYSMTQVSVTPPTDPELSAIEVLCLGSAFTAQSGIDIDFRMSGIATGDQDTAYSGAKVTVTSNGSGIARWEAPRGATIEYKRGTTQVWTRATLDNDSLTSVTSVIGSP